MLAALTAMEVARTRAVREYIPDGVWYVGPLLVIGLRGSKLVCDRYIARSHVIYDITTNNVVYEHHKRFDELSMYLSFDGMSVCIERENEWWCVITPSSGKNERYDWYTDPMPPALHQFPIPYGSKGRVWHTRYGRMNHRVGLDTTQGIVRVPRDAAYVPEGYLLCTRNQFHIVFNDKTALLHTSDCIGGFCHDVLRRFEQTAYLDMSRHFAA